MSLNSVAVLEAVYDHPFMNIFRLCGNSSRTDKVHDQHESILISRTYVA